MNILIVDYGMGNLRSVKRSFEECGANANISDNPKDILSATHIVIPGVGAFRDGMANLRNQGWVDIIEESVNEGIPTLGICLGMQLLATKGFEGGEIPGLNLISGQVIKLVPSNNDTKIPHIGWNEVHKKQDSALLSGIKDGADFYFVHSFHFEAVNSDDISLQRHTVVNLTLLLVIKMYMGYSFILRKVVSLDLR